MKSLMNLILNYKLKIIEWVEKRHNKNENKIKTEKLETKLKIKKNNKK